MLDFKYRHVCEISVLALPFHTPCNAWHMMKHSNIGEALKQWALASQSSFCELFIRALIQSASAVVSNAYSS